MGSDLPQENGMRGYNGDRQYGLDAWGISDYDTVNQILIDTTREVFGQIDDHDTIGFRVLNNVLDELYQKHEMIYDGHSVAFRMFSVFMGNEELTAKRNRLAALILERLAPFWKYSATVRGDVLRVW